MSLQQFKPARAKKKVLVHEILNKEVWDEQKADGERFIIHTFDEGHRCTSRRIGVSGLYVEKTDRVPHLNQIPFKAHCMLDNEFVSSGDIVKVDLPGHLWDKMDKEQGGRFIRTLGYLPAYPHVKNTTSIMGSLADLAIQKQEERGKIWSYCFDIVRYDSKWTTNNTQADRRRFLAKLFESVDPESGLILMPRWLGLTPDERLELFTLITDIKGEGLILKDPKEPYDAASAWYKLKIEFPVDCVLTGEYKMGKTGKVLGFVGSLEIGVYRNGILVPVGWMSAIMDSEANLPELTRLAEAGQLRGRVYECRHNGIQDEPSAALGFTLRHPRHRRPRFDKNASQCTLEALLAECGETKKYGKAN